MSFAYGVAYILFLYDSCYFHIEVRVVVIPVALRRNCFFCVAFLHYVLFDVHLLYTSILEILRLAVIPVD